MSQVSDRIAAALRERDLDWSLPTAPPDLLVLDAWKYVALASVPVAERLRRSDLGDLDDAFLGLCHRVGLELGPVLVSFGVDASPWVTIDLRQHTEVVELLSLISQEPSFLLASPDTRVLVAVDTEEWEFWLIALAWSRDGGFSSLG